MKYFMENIMVFSFVLLISLSSIAKNQPIKSTFTDHPQNISTVTVVDSTKEIDLEIKKFLDNRYCLGLLFGYSSLKVIPDWGAEDLISKLPRIGMSFNVVRLGRRIYLGGSLPTYLEATFGVSKGCLHFNYSDPNTIVSSSDNPLKYKSGEPLHITEDIDVTNTIFGGSAALTVPLYFQLKPRRFFLSPKGIFLNLKLGADVLILRAENNELPYIGYSKSLDGGYTQTGAITGEVITVGDWVLFYIGLGIDYVVGRNFILKIDTMIGAYPVSGPGTMEGGTVEPIGPPDTWGGNKAILFGFEFLL
jgi:hypothetical protein